MTRARPQSFLRSAILFVLIALPGLAGPSRAEAQNNRTRFRVRVDPAALNEAVTGRVYVMISRTNEREPRMQIGRTGVPFFGHDVEKLAPGTFATIDGSELGFPLDAMSDLPAGDYWVQGFVNRYSEFKRADGHTVWMHDDQWEGQRWNRSPGNLYSDAQQVHLDPARGWNVELTASHVIPPVETPPDNAWVKSFRFQSPTLTKFWGRPIYLGATVLLPRDYDQDTTHYPVLYEQGHFSLRPPLGFSERSPIFSDWVRERFPAHDRGHVPAPDALLRRLLRRQLGQRRTLRRRDHAGADPGDREAVPGDPTAVGALALRRLDRRLGIARAADLPPRLLRRHVVLLPGPRHVHQRRRLQH